MATNIINIGFKGTYPSSTADRTGYVTDLDFNDVFYFLGTNYGTQAWVPPATTSNLTFTNTTGSFFGPAEEEVLFDSNLTTYINSGGGAETITAQFNTARVQPTFVQLYIDFTFPGAQVQNLVLEGSNDNVVWDELTDITPTVTGSGPQVFEFPSLFASAYYEYLRLRVSNINNTGVRLTQWKVYGNLFRTDGGEASSVTPVTAVEGLPKFIPEPSGVKDGDLLFYEGGVVTNRRNTLYETERIVMTGNLVLSAEHYPNFYILDPNGATRTVDLPASPLESQFIRIKTLDPLFTININDGGTVATLDSSTLMIEAYYDETDWVILNYG